MGLWVNVSAACTLCCPGESPGSTPITLHVGWNLVGYPRSAPAPVAEALVSIAGKYLVVYGYRPDTPADPWRCYDVGASPGSNTLLSLDPGQGYWIYATEECALIY